MIPLYFFRQGSVLLVITLGISLQLIAQKRRRGNSLSEDLRNPGSYSILSNDPGRVHRLSLTVSPFNFTLAEPASINIGAQLTYLNQKQGLVKVGVWRSKLESSMSDDPYTNSPTGFSGDQDNGYGFFDETEIGFTKFIVTKTKTFEYDVQLRRFGGGGNTTIILVQPVEGDLTVAYGFHFGVSRQDGSYYDLVHAKTYGNVAGIYGFQRNTFFFGFAKTTFGTMIIDHSRYGVRGSTSLDNIYFDVLWAPQQNIHYALNMEHEEAAAFDPLKDIKRFPFGFRIGYDGMGALRTGSFISGANVEIGLRPTFIAQYNEFYLGIKIGLGAGFIRTGGKPSRMERVSESSDDGGSSSSVTKKSKSRGYEEPTYNDARKYQNKGSYKRGRYKKAKTRFGN